MGWFEDKKTLEEWREKKIRNSDKVIELYNGLKPYMSKLGDDVWSTLEQVYIAALDTDNQPVQKECYQRLKQQFGAGSMRLGRLLGMQYEAYGRWESANKLYEELLEKDPTNSTIMKRQVAVLIGQGDRAAAIKKLNEYLKTFMIDFEAWQELADLYLKEHEYAMAGFCFEELILSNPQHHVFHTKYAEILYTMGGTENLTNARKYFAQSVKLHANNPRALWGLLMTSTKLAPKAKSSIDKDMIAFAKDKLAAMYPAATQKSVAHAQTTLEKL